MAPSLRHGSRLPEFCHLISDTFFGRALRSHRGFLRLPDEPRKTPAGQLSVRAFDPPPRNAPRHWPPNSQLTFVAGLDAQFDQGFERLAPLRFLQRCVKHSSSPLSQSGRLELLGRRARDSPKRTQSRSQLPGAGRPDARDAQCGQPTIQRRRSASFDRMENLFRVLFWKL